MALIGKKINELESISSLTNDTVIPSVRIDGTVTEDTATKITLADLKSNILEGVQLKKTIFTDTESSEIYLSNLDANTIYQFGELELLSIADFTTSYLESIIYFETGDAFELTFVQEPVWITGTQPTFEPNKKYVINFKNGIASVEGIAEQTTTTTITFRNWREEIVVNTNSSNQTPSEETIIPIEPEEPIIPEPIEPDEELPTEPENPDTPEEPEEQPSEDDKNNSGENGNDNEDSEIQYVGSVTYVPEGYNYILRFEINNEYNYSDDGGVTTKTLKLPTSNLYCLSNLQYDAPNGTTLYAEPTLNTPIAKVKYRSNGWMYDAVGTYNGINWSRVLHQDAPEYALGTVTGNKIEGGTNYYGSTILYICEKQNGDIVNIFYDNDNTGYSNEPISHLSPESVLNRAKELNISFGYNNTDVIESCTDKSLIGTRIKETIGRLFII